MAKSPTDLVPGKVDPEHLQCLLSFTKISGTDVKAALHAYFVDGKRPKDICKSQGAATAEGKISPSLLSRKSSDIRRVHEELKAAMRFYRNE